MLGIRHYKSVAFDLWQGELEDFFCDLPFSQWNNYEQRVITERLLSKLNFQLFVVFADLGQFLKGNPGFAVRKSRDFPKFPKIVELSEAQTFLSVKIFLLFQKFHGSMF